MGIPAQPRAPRDVPDMTPLDHTAAAVHDHRGRLVDARRGVGEGQTRQEVAGHALAALALAHALAGQALASRWVDVRDALVHGAGLDDVAEAMGLTTAEVADGLRAWADGQERVYGRYGSGGLSPAHAEEVRALVPAPRAVPGPPTSLPLRDPRWWGHTTTAEAGELAVAVDAVPGLGHFLAAAVLDPRWTGAVEALGAGLPVEQVAAQVGITPSELRSGLRSWADRLYGEAHRVDRLAAVPGPGGDRETGPGAAPGPGGPDRAARVIEGVPCLPGCHIPDVEDHLCISRVGTLRGKPAPGGRERFAVVEVDQTSEGRAVVVAELGDDGHYRGGDPVVVPPGAVPQLIVLLLAAQRTAQ